MRKEKIDLFIGISEDKFMGRYYEEEKKIFLNLYYQRNTDHICETLSHELIHHFQEGNPLDIEINDDLVAGVFMYENDFKIDSRNDFICELEAYTYDKVPYFAVNFIKRKKELLEFFRISKYRKSAINWISQNKCLPIYPNNIFEKIFGRNFINLIEYRDYFIKNQ